MYTIMLVYVHLLSLLPQQYELKQHSRALLMFLFKAFVTFCIGDKMLRVS